MLSIALRTLRTRWITFVGTFVALALGVGLIATMGLGLASTLDAPEQRPERFAAAPLVVRGTDTLRVPIRHGEKTKQLDQPRPLPQELVRKLSAPGRAVPDRSFAVRAPGGPAALVGHPWSTAAYAPYEIGAGRAPAAYNEVLVTGDWARTGDRLKTDRGPVTVVGTAPDRGFEDAMFFTDARAAQISPRVDALVVDAHPKTVRKHLGDVPAQVLTGSARHLADADPERDKEALVAVNALLGTAAGVTGFVSVFVVASTFAFAVAQRRRELGLLRTAGATPRQIRRMVLSEALLVAVLASAAGCALGRFGAPLLAGWMVDGGVAPRWFAIGDHAWPYHLAFWTGLGVALAGVVAASRRAGRVGPTEALREAAVDHKAMTAGRWTCGGALLLTGLGLLVFALLDNPGELLGRKAYTSRPMLLITAFALLSPVLVRPLTRLLGWLPARLPGAVGMLVRENAAAAVRRTAAIAAPVLVTVALTGSLYGATATLNEAKAREVRAHTAADFVLTKPGDAVFDTATVDRVRQVPGAVTSATGSSSVFVLEEGTALLKSDARSADPAALAAVARLPLAAGKVSDLDDRSVIVNEEWERHRVGQRVDIWRADGTKVALRIAAVLRTGTGNNGVYVTPHNAAGAPVDRIDVKLAPGAQARAVADRLRAAVEPSGGRVLTKDQWVAAGYPTTNEHTRLGYLVVLGIALVYTGIALANTLVMATSDRKRELAALRLAGATPRQVLRLVAAESATVVAVGALLGAAVAALNLLGIWGALGVLRVPSPLLVPWREMGAVAGACAALAVIAAVVPAAFALRRRPAELAGMRE